jgi:hypothetical protein
LFHKGKNLKNPPARLPHAVATIRVSNPLPTPTIAWVGAIGLFSVDHTQRQLLEIVLALHPASRLPRHLHRWQEQRHENANDGNHNEQLDECKSARSTHLTHAQKTENYLLTLHRRSELQLCDEISAHSARVCSIKN